MASRFIVAPIRRLVGPVLLALALGGLGGWFAFVSVAPRECYTVSPPIPAPGATFTPVSVAGGCVLPDVLTGSYGAPFEDAPAATPGIAYVVAGAALAACGAMAASAALTRLNPTRLGP